MGGNGRVPICTVGCDRVVCIATRYGLDCLGIESRWGRIFPLPSRLIVEPTQLSRVFPGNKPAGAWPCPPTLILW
jgi:hypothetical protein